MHSLVCFLPTYVSLIIYLFIYFYEQENLCSPLSGVWS